MKKLLLTLSILALAASTLLAVTQTGNLIIIVMSEEGQMLPGATVVISSNVLMGTRTQATDANGKATFRLLPPGVYTAEVTMDGFKPTKKENIIIRIQKISKEEIKLELGEAAEYITVVDITPIVDTTSSTTSVEFDFNHYINHMPTYKHYTTIVGFAGGAGAGNNPSVLGGGMYSNLYLVDGVNTTDMTTQTWGTQFTIDTVQDMSFQLTGVQAEYGYLQGGLLNLVTKSGSNELHGTIRLELKRKGWNDISYNGPTDETGSQQGRGENRWDISGGGPLYPNMIWWYIGFTKRQEERYYQRWLDPMVPGADGLSDAIYGYYGHFLNIKGTIQPTEDIKIMGHYKEDPIELPNIGSGVRRLGRNLPSADWTQYQGGDSTYVLGSWVFTENAFIEARWNDTNSTLDCYGNTAEWDFVTEPSQTTGTFFYSADGWYWGAVDYTLKTNRNHDIIAADLNYLLETDSIGEHDIKGGWEYMDVCPEYAQTSIQSGERIYTSNLGGIGYDNVDWWVKVVIDGPRLPLTGNNVKYNNFYVQDSAQLMDELTLNIGLRAEFTKGINNHDVEVCSWDIGDTLAPRIGFAYDLGGHAIHGSFSRYYDMMDPYLIRYTDTYDYQESWKYYRPNDWSIDDPGDGRTAGWSSTPYQTRDYGGLTSPHEVSPDLKPQYMDEFALGFDYLISNNMSVGIVGVWRQYRDLICYNDLDYDGAYYVINLDSPSKGTLYKEYKGIVFSFRKRPTEDNLFIASSFTLGNSQGVFSESDWLGLYLSAPWENPEDIDLWWGTLSPPNWNFKLQGTYFFPNGWYIGAQFVWEAGLQLSTRTISTWTGEYGYGELYYSYPNGVADLERLPDWVNLDIQFGLEQPIELPFQVPFTDNAILIGIYANILNALNNQDASNMETRDYISLYQQYTVWRAARSYELGFRIEL